MGIIRGFFRFIGSCFSSQDGDKIPQQQAFSDDIIDELLEAMPPEKRAWVRGNLTLPFNLGTINLVKQLSKEYDGGKR